MRLSGARLGEFLRRPDPQIRAVLLYGPDAGLVRERAEGLARHICPDFADPFRIADLDAAALAADPARLADEVAQMSFGGGRRVVRVREAGDRLAPLFAGFLDKGAGDAFIVAEAGELPSRSTLRRAFETAKSAAAIGCYSDSARDLAEVIRDSLSAHRISASRDALQYLVAHLGGDRLLTRSELEKLALYAGEGGRAELVDVQLSIGDSAAIELDDAIMAAAEGDAPRLERALFRVFGEGQSPVTTVRALLRHLQRLHALAGEIASGKSAAEVLRAARPPIFFKQQESFRRQLALWSEVSLRPQLDRLAAAELAMKTTGLPAETLCREAMQALAQAAHESATTASRR